jgi:hypothetical protein
LVLVLDLIHVNESPTRENASMADAEEPFTLLFVCVQPVDEDGCRVVYSRKFDRVPHLSLNTAIGHAWRSELQRTPDVFDGGKFRLASVASPEKASSEGAAGPTLHLGLTGYREYLGTNRLDAPLLARLIRDGEAHHGDAAAHLSNALGCEAVLITSDNYAVLLRRSSAVATHGGLYNGPSGHPEPARAGIGSDAYPSRDGDGGATAGMGVNSLRLDQAAAQPQSSGAASLPPDPDSRRAASELFDSVVQETVEETGIPRGALSAPLLLGVMADSCGKPDALFLLFTHMDAAAVRAAYKSGAAAERWESDRILLIRCGQLLCDTHDLEASLGVRLTCVTRAAVECLRRARALHRCGGAGELPVAGEGVAGCSSQQQARLWLHRLAPL